MPDTSTSLSEGGEGDLFRFLGFFAGLALPDFLEAGLAAGLTSES